MVVKGGNRLSKEKAIDVFYDGENVTVFETPVLENNNIGAGCTFASSIASQLVLGKSAKAAVEEYASANNLKFDYVQLGSYPELAVSLYAYRIDAFAGDKSILSGYESDKTKILDEGFKTQEYGIASSKSNQELIDYTNDLIAKMAKKMVAFKKLYDKYHLKPAKAEDK